MERPVCMFGRENLDFGRGFYVTPLLKQASDWAAATAKRRNSSALINVYSLDREAVIKEGKCRIFNAYDHEWLDFIVASRAPYDYIEGGVANDRVIDTINLYMAGLMDSDTALRRLAIHRPNNQICLLNQELTDKYLIYERTEHINISSMSGQNTFNDPVKSPEIQETILSNRIGIISAELSKRLRISPSEALQLFYGSKTCADLHDKETGLYLYGDLYIADEFIREYQDKI